MRIHHSWPTADFLIIPNETLRDERLSLAARGELAYLLSLPDGWNTTADAETKRARALRGKRGEGRDSMRRVYAELKNAGYIRYVRTQDNGICTTVIHVFDRPSTDVRLTDTPETRMSVPPAETPKLVDNPPETFSQVAPMYGSPGVGKPVIGEPAPEPGTFPQANGATGTFSQVAPMYGSPVHREAVHSYEDGTTEDPLDDGGGVGDPIADKGQPSDHDQDQRQEHPIANSQERRVPDGSGNGGADAQRIPPDHSESPATDRYAHASRPASWRTPQQIAAEQVAEARASREAAARAAAVTQ